MEPALDDALVRSPFEEGDDGVNDGGHDGCGANCALGPYCGDGVPQEDAGEVCDDRKSTPNDGCTGCQLDFVE